MTGSWPIRRTKPIGLTLGRAIPAFVHNFDFHLTTVDAYADGAIDAWGFLDLDLFRKKVASGWVATRPPIGARISVFNLGMATPSEGRWLLEPEDIIDRVERAVRELNPRAENLLDMEGTDVEVRGNVRYAKLGLSNKKPCFHEGAIVVGDEVPIFRRVDDGFHLERWFVFADGSSCIGTEEPRRDLDSVIARARAGELCTRVPDGAWVTIGELGAFRVSKGAWNVKVEERVREVLHVLRESRGDDSSIAECRKAHARYEGAPTAENRDLLREAYEAVPEHLRMYCGDMDSKDWPIRAILYGKKK